MEISFKQVGFIYQQNTPMENIGLEDINLTINDHSFTALIGHTGSGKSTFVQHINALLKPTSGEIKVGEKTITPETNNKDLKPLRQQVGMVFQFPESQLFEETVERDIMFGPMNFGMSEEEAKQMAKKALHQVGLPEEYLEKSPFDLSGGQMRRVAIAGVLASNPKTLILDEPTAGLDPEGRLEMMTLFNNLYHEGKSIILVTHNMEDVVNYADDVVVFNHGKVAKHGTPSEIFADEQWIKDNNLELPRSVEFMNQLKAKGLKTTDNPLVIKELIETITNNI
ncbi:energy-coupling factor transporter ATP-binding protein EcfA2 [Companilactobacillus sp. RD055328]|uniref:energy-coupling factor ABC transporter ATP-binding protein n=1 Tax=Companilactobacillus sp. RD055328 TaxID=2916634 RepID=UPI001FC7DBD9|nr:energy-coupling factor ABC transporter ATP-binding protein [Companilactobacillus sp. RD055328]GKQ42234.1 energy-coupling factor transporter ATP-binding protein EcfA2 [Companilactobacillus sp. RD055328]